MSICRLFYVSVALLLSVSAALSASPTATQLPNNIPYLCPNSPDNVAAGPPVIWSGTVTKDCVQVAGTLLFADDLDLRATTIQVLPGGQLDTVNHPAKLHWRVRDITPTDPEQWGTGLVAIGTARLEGEPTMTWTRLAADAAAGASSAQLQSTVGIAIGGQLAFGDERHLFGSQENTPRVTQYVTVTGLSGNAVSFTPGLAIPHKAARANDGTVTRYPPVAYVTRSIVIESENPTGARGHIVFTGAASGSLKYVDVRNLGRTPNDASSTAQAGRYALHEHMGTGHVEFVGDVVRAPAKWGISIHQTTGHLIENNVFVDAKGWGVGTEMATSDNIFHRNLTINTTGDGSRGDRCRSFDSPPICRGTAGVGQWLDTTNDFWRENVDVGGYITCYQMFGNRTTPIREFSNNECWGSRAGLTLWEITGGTIQNFFEANTWLGLYNYSTRGVVYRDWIGRGDPANVPPSPAESTGMDWGDYWTPDAVIEHADIQNKRVGIRPPWGMADVYPGMQTASRAHAISDSTFCGNGTDIAYYVNATMSTDLSIVPTTTRAVRDLHCAASALHISYSGVVRPQDGSQRVIVEDYQRNASDDLEVFNAATAPSHATTRAKFADKVIGGNTSGSDSDGDGVLDPVDKCPGTPTGTTVDAAGCAIVTPPMDSDGDGVVDANDKCPGTPAGTPVDAAGCAIVTQGPTVTLNPTQKLQQAGLWEVAVLGSTQDYSGLTDAQISAMLDLSIGDIGFNRARLSVQAGIESSTGKGYTIVNDNADPNVVNAAGFNWSNLDLEIDKLIVPMRAKAAAKGETFYVNAQYVDHGDSPFEHRDNPAEYGEFWLAVFQHIQSKYGFVPNSVELLNEPENTTWTCQQLGPALVAAKSRLNAAGFTPAFIAPSTANPSNGPACWDAMASASGGVLPDEFAYHRYGGTLADLQAIGAKATTVGKRTSQGEGWGSGGTSDGNSYQHLYQDVTAGLTSSWHMGPPVAGGSCAWGPIVAWLNGTATACPNAPLVRQYTKYVRMGAQRIGATGTATFLPVAFINADGKYVVVVKAEGASGAFSVAGLPAGAYGVYHMAGNGQGSPTNAADVTAVAGQPLALSIPYEGVITVYAKSGGPPPPPDSDGDGVPDATDKCPTQPGPASNNGCPVQPPPGLTVAYLGPARDLVSTGRVLSPDGASDQGFTVTFPTSATVTRFRLVSSASGGWDTDPTPSWVAGVSATATSALVNAADGKVNTTGTTFYLYVADGGSQRFPVGSTATVTATVGGVDVVGAVTIGTSPPTDTDGDGVPDSTDKCPTQAGPASNSGCPIVTDTDGDGVADSVDKCPTQPGPASNSGCPVSQGTTVAVTPSTCRVTMEATPPAGFTAPSARIFNVGTGTSTGTADSAAPYIPSTTVSVGTYQLAIRWTQSGVTTVTYPTQTVKCGG